MKPWYSDSSTKGPHLGINSMSFKPHSFPLSLKFASTEIYNIYKNLDKACQRIKRTECIETHIRGPASCQFSGKFRPGCGQAGHLTVKLPGGVFFTPAGSCPRPARLRAMRFLQIRKTRWISLYRYWMIEQLVHWITSAEKQLTIVLDKFALSVLCNRRW